MGVLKEEFDLLLQHNDWDENTILCIKEMYSNLKTYKYLLNKYTTDNIAQLLLLANNIKIENNSLRYENNMLKRKISELKYNKLENLNLI